MIKHLLLLITFSQAPAGIEIKHVATFENAHECATHSEIHNYLAKDQLERLVCIKAKI